MQKFAKMTKIWGGGELSEELRVKSEKLSLFAFMALCVAMVPTAAWADKVRVYDVDDYVQDGLVAHFDGIRNAGATAAHATSGTKWANIGSSGSAYDATLQSWNSNPVNGEWTATGYHFNTTDTNTFAAIDTAIDLGTNWTIQLATTVDIAKQTKADSGVKRYPSYLNTYDNSNANGVWTENKTTRSSTVVCCFDNYIASGNLRPTIGSWRGEYVTTMLDAEKRRAYCFQTDVLPASGTAISITKSPGAKRYTWSGAPGKQPLVDAMYYNVRMYNRVLTADEIKHNRVVDESRFRNETTKGLLPNVIVVGADGTSANEKYFVTGSETFTAPETVINRKGAFRRYGNVVETWDGSAWSGATTNLSGSCEIVVASGDAAKRITWLWTDIMRSYDVDDYVQDGLVLHFDGIRNAGATAEHATSGTKWANIGSSGSAYDATLQSWNSNPVNGEWTATGYHFNTTDTNTFAAIDTAIDLGTNWTIQLAMTVDIAKQTIASDGAERYPSYLNTYEHSNANGVWTDNKTARSSTIVCCFDNYIASGKKLRPEIGSWRGEYVTTMLDAEKRRAYCFQTDALPASGTAISITRSPGAKRYTWSGGPGMQPLVDAMYYSVRMYTNTLDAAQIALNRKIDEARFRGNCDVTIVNGAIGETGTNGESSFPDGCYNLGDGESWTLTAPEVKSDGHTYQPKLLVEQYNAATGEWEATTAKPQWTNSYTVDKSILGDNRIRLTWTWEIRKGLIITFF